MHLPIEKPLPDWVEAIIAGCYPGATNTRGADTIRRGFRANHPKSKGENTHE